MKRLSGSNWMWVIIVLLIILNISELAFIWIKLGGRPGPPPGPRGDERDQAARFFKTELGLNDEQVEQFLQQRKEHQMASLKLQDEMQGLKMEMLGELFQEPADTAKVTRLINEIGERNKELERLTFNHFATLKELCGDQQQERLRKLLQEFFRRQQRPPRPDSDRPRGDGPPPPPPNAGGH